MIEQDIILEFMMDLGLSREQLAEKAGYKDKSGLIHQLNNSNMKVNVFNKILSAMGGEIIVRCNGKEIKLTYDGIPTQARYDFPLNLDDILSLNI